MRLENKMHKWLKFFIKSLPFWFLIFSLLNVLFNETTVFNINEIMVDFFSHENIFYSIMKNFTVNFETKIQFTTIINDLLYLIFGIRALALENFYLYNVFFYIFATFFWWVIIDIIDLVFSAFRFIINLAHSWLDSFYEKSKRGGK